MSDLQCPARVFLARHGEAAYETELLMDHGGSLTARGRAQARELGEKLRAEKIAHVYSSTISRAVQTAELAAAVLGVAVTVREGLVELALGEAYGVPAGTGIFVREMQAWVAGDVEARGAGQRERRRDRGASARRCSTTSPTSTAARRCWSSATAARSSRPRPCWPSSRAGHWDLANCSYVGLEGDADGWRALG